MKHCIEGTAYISVLHYDTRSFRHMAYTGYIAGMSLRLAQGADSEVNANTRYYLDHVLALSVISGKVAAVKFLLDRYNYTVGVVDAFTRAVSYGVTGAIIPLIRAGATVTPRILIYAHSQKMTRILLTLSPLSTQYGDASFRYAMCSDRFTGFSCHP